MLVSILFSVSMEGHGILNSGFTSHRSQIDTLDVVLFSCGTCLLIGLPYYTRQFKSKIMKFNSSELKRPHVFYSHKLMMMFTCFLIVVLLAFFYLTWIQPSYYRLARRGLEDDQLKFSNFVINYTIEVNMLYGATN